MPFAKSPLLALAACFALGITQAPPGSAPSPPALGSIPLLLASSAVCLLVGLVLLGGPPPLPAPPLAAAPETDHSQSATIRIPKLDWRESSCTLLVLGGFVFAGASASRLFEFRFPPHDASHLTSFGLDLTQSVDLEGRLVSNLVRTSGGSLQFDLAASAISQGRGPRHRLAGKVRLWMRTPANAESFAAQDALGLDYGRWVRVRVDLRRPRSYRNPGTFDYRRWMESYEDIWWEGSIASPVSVERLPSAPNDALTSWLEPVAGMVSRVRKRLLSTIDRLYPAWQLEGRDGAVLKAVLLGDRSALDSDTVESFRKAGLYHLLVVAGLHVGLLAFLLTSLLQQLGLRQYWRATAVLTLLFGYALLVEQRAPTLRATLMISAYLVARLLGREQAALNAIGLAALALLLTRPPWLFEAGFELSFAAALLIAAVAVPILNRATEPYRRSLEHLDEVGLDAAIEPRAAQLRLDLRSLIAALRNHVAFLDHHPAAAQAFVIYPARIAIWAAEMLLFSAILQLGLLLPMAETFHRVTLAGIGLNALAIPVMTALLALAIPTVLLGLVSIPLATTPARALHLIMQCLFALTDLPHLPRYLSFRVASPPAWVAWGFGLALTAAGCLLGRRGSRWREASLRVSLAGAAIFGLLIALDPFPPRLPQGVLEVTALDCGDGQALLLVLPDERLMLVDAGGGRTGARSMAGVSGEAFRLRRWDPGEEIVSPYLWSRGVKQLDVLVLAGARQEHLGGLEAILENFRVDELWYSRSLREAMTEGQRRLLEVARQRGTRLRELATGDVIGGSDAQVTVLWPPNSLPDSAPYSPSAGNTASHNSARNAWLNANSLVLRVSAGRASLLLPGDTSEKVERQLAQSGEPLRSQVLGLARRGAESALSPEFLGRISPRLALWSAPSGATAGFVFEQKLRHAGARVYRTDLDGAVTVEVKGSETRVCCYGDPRCGG